MVLAGIGVSTVAGGLNSGKAEAADGDTVKLARANSSTGGTELAVNGANGGSKPALRLRNSDGPALDLGLVPDDRDGDLAVGHLANTSSGPLIGVNYGVNVGDAEVSFLATGVDLDAIPTPVAVGPERIPRHPKRYQSSNHSCRVRHYTLRRCWPTCRRGLDRHRHCARVVGAGS